MGNWLERHPVLSASLVATVVYALNWHRTFDFIATLAIMAFFEIAFLWAEVARLREKLEDLERRNDG
jgi:hypothetical protein